MLRKHSEGRNRALKEIEAASIEGRWQMPRPGIPNPTVSLLLPYDCIFMGNAFTKNEDGLFVRAGTLRVNFPELRGNGIGERLTKSLGALANKHQYPKIVANMASEYSLDIFGRVFGPESMTFHGTDTYRGVQVELPISFDEARDVLVALGTAEPDPEHRNLSIETHVDLAKVSEAAWETPKDTTLGPNFDWSLVQATKQGS